MKSATRKGLIAFFAVIAMAVMFVFSVSATESKEISNISVSDATVIQNYDGWYEEENGKSYFYYYTPYIPYVTVTYTDGTTEITDFLELELNYNEWVDISDSQSVNTPWTIGKYTVNYSFLGFEGQYEVEVIESPVEKITVENMELCYFGDGTYEEILTGYDYFYYYTSPKMMTVYYKDGTKLSGSADGISEITGEFVDVYDNQDKSAWGIGKYKCKAAFMGVEATYYVTIKESPVKKIEVENIILYEGIDGIWGSLWGDSDDFEYTVKPEKVTVYYKDGSAFTGSVEEIEESTGYTVNYEDGKSWSYGNHTATASYLGATTKFTATVKEYPIKKVQLVKAPSKTSYYPGEVVDPSGAVIRVTYTDGRTEDVELVHDYIDTDILSCRLEKIGKDAEIYISHTVESGDTKATFEIFDNSFTVEFTTKAKKVTDIAAATDSNGQPAVDFTFSDGSSVKAKVVDIIGENINRFEESDSCYTVVMTDIGNFSAYIEKDSNGYSFTFLYICEDGDRTISFDKDTVWAVSSMNEKAEIIYNNYNGSDAYNGLVATDNIDDLITFAAAGSDAGKPKEIYEDYYVYTATEIQKSVKDFFALDGIDISCSKNYDSRTNTIRIRKIEDSFMYSDSQRVRHPVSYTYKNGYYNAEYVFGDGKKMSITTDSNGRVASYKVLDPVSHKHVMITIAAVAPTYIKTGLTEGVKCSTCGEVLTQQKVVDKLILGKPAKIVSAGDTKQIKLTWSAVKGATGYEVFYRSGGIWKNLTTSTANSEIVKGLAAGKKYAFAVRAYVIESGKVIKANEYITIETATQAKAPSKVISKQNANAIQLQWAKSEGATGYAIYYKTVKGWVFLGHTAKTVATFNNLSAGSKYDFAIRPYIKTSSEVVWGIPAYYSAATNPQAPATAAGSLAKGTITLKFGTVRGADAYQIYYKMGNGSYKLYKNYATAGTLNFKNLKSGDTYTFVVRAATKTSGGWIYSPYTPVSAKVK